MTKKRFRKLERAALEAPEADRYGDPTAEIGILTWGSTVGSVIEAIDLAALRWLEARYVSAKNANAAAGRAIAPIHRKQTYHIPTRSQL